MSQGRTLSRTRRTQILQAAVGVISERGLCDTRISDIATRAGASSALVIYYFGTKDRLLAQALTYSEESFYSQTARELAGLESAKDRLIRLVELSCSVGNAEGDDWLDEWVLWLDLWARAPRDSDVARDREALDRRWRETIAGIVRDGQSRGEFGPVDADEFALLFAALIDGLAVQVVLGDADVSPARMFDLCIRTAAGQLGFRWDGRTPQALLPAAAPKDSRSASSRGAPVRVKGASG